MKKRIFAVASLLAVSSLGATQAARAQEPMTVNIPFAFTAGDNKVTLPPGEYRVEKLNGIVLLIRRVNPAASVMVTTISKEGREQQTKSKLVFHRCGNSYFLSQVWSAGYFSGREIPKSTREKELSQSAKVETQNQVVLYARLAPAKP